MLIRSFLNDRRGSLVPMFALALLATFGSVGVALDYSRAAAARTELQAVLDSVALMLTREAPNLSKTQLKRKAQQYVKTMFDRPETRRLKINPEYVIDGNRFRITVSGSTSVDTAFVQLFGYKRIEIGTTAVVEWEQRRLELALALDNTGSMSTKNKMKELKKAVKSLLKTLEKTAKTPDHIKVALVPFDTVVNAGTDAREASWIDFNGFGDPGAWTGCIADRDQPYDVQDNAGSALFPAAKCKDSGALELIRPLTNDWTALERATEAMTPSGNTNVTIGLVWAWHALTPGAPITQASAPRSDLDKVIVLLTDGNNTQNRWESGAGAATRIDPRTKLACENVKAAGIKLYTIRVLEGNAAMLEGCASTPAMFFDVKDASQLNAVFASIGNTLTAVRVAR